MNLDLRSMNKRLNFWYEKNKRTLPWRESRDPYRIWISEVMLQQTTVQVVTPYYEKFMKRFPRVEMLAEAPESEVLGMWSGLGYYSRARSLHKAAKEVAARDGKFPKKYEELLDLPGVGPYTAAAIASIAHDENIAVVDGNVQRVLARIFDIGVSPFSSSGKKLFFETAQKFLQGQKPSSHNQAVMELGATVCTPKNPACLICPLMQDCLARKLGKIQIRPVKKERRESEPWLWELYIAQKGDKIALTENAPVPWLKGMWLLPSKAMQWTKKNPPDHAFRHQITHHKIFVRLKSVAATQLPKSCEIKWIPKKNLHLYGLSSVVKKALAVVD